MGKRYIHHGSSKFCAKAFVPITNLDVRNKPLGGLWASPSDAEYGWFEWSMQNGFFTDRLKKSFEFELSQDVKILELTPDNVWDLPTQESVGLWDIRKRQESHYGMVMGVDFEALAKEYDVLECSITKHPRLYWSLYGWDCDSILVLNPSVIVEVSE